MNSFVARCPTRTPPPPPTHTSLPDPPPRLLTGQDRTGQDWTWPGGLKEGEFYPLHHSRFHRFPVAAGSLPLPRCACAGAASAGEGESGQSWLWEAEGGEQRSTCEKGEVVGER